MRFHAALQSIVRNRSTLFVAASVVVMVVLLGSLFFVRGKTIMERQLKERLRTTAAVAVLQFDASLVQRVRTKEDLGKPEFRELVRQMRSIRERVTSIRFAYIMRKTDEPAILAFVADADALSSVAELDHNGNGQLDEEELSSLPGDLYDAEGIPALENEAFTRPAVDEEVTVDQWGHLISGYAPIRGADGDTVAILGLDMDAAEFESASQQVFSPVAFLLLALIGICFAAYVLNFIQQRRLASLREVEAERSALLDLTLHQLGAPLATFKWWLEILKEKQGQEEGLAALAEMDQGVGRMDEIMKALREANMVKEKAIEYHPELGSLREVLETVRTEYTPILGRKNQRIAVSAESCTMPMPLDKKLIHGVLSELIENASAYSPAGTDITIDAACSRKGAEVHVRDEGYGIPSKDLPNIFRKFTRAANASKYKPVGNGLGLFIARGIIERAGGEMWIDSVEGKGTTVSFSLPVSE